MMLKRLAQLILGKPLHADKQAATMAWATRPLFDVAINRLPAAKIEIPHAEVGPVGDLQCLA